MSLLPLGKDMECGLGCLWGSAFLISLSNALSRDLTHHSLLLPELHHFTGVGWRDKVADRVRRQLSDCQQMASSYNKIKATPKYNIVNSSVSNVQKPLIILQSSKD